MTAGDGAPLPEPGWYPDQVDPFLLRYWDGTTWTDHTTSRAQAEAATAHASGSPAFAPGEPAGYGFQPVPGTEPVAEGGNSLSVIALVCSALALFLGGVLFGGIGIVLSVMARRRGEPLARIAVPVSVVCTVLGLIVAVFAFSRL